jgi:hypothetical protein
MLLWDEGLNEHLQYTFTVGLKTGLLGNIRLHPTTLLTVALCLNLYVTVYLTLRHA